MSSYDKVVKLACKPKAAPPKAKYLDPIIAATWSEDGAVHDVCKALSPRFREPNAIVVFKALLVLHTMIRNGATDNVLSYLSSSEVLRLRNVSAGNWEGYAAPENLQNYAVYLDSRIRAYRDLKHDAIRVQAETNRDMRNSLVDDDPIPPPSNSRNGSTKNSSNGPTRSKTIMGRKLRIMTVEKGLLRETKAVHRMIDTLVECRFYLDDLEDELTTTALRMLVKDLLILFQAGNEGVINVLEHYFEMSHIDATEALAIYRHFCKQTDRVVEYLGVAKKLQNILNVPIPNLKHAPVSLAGALEEYLNDPNFEQNRIEYKTNKDNAERQFKKNGVTSSVKKSDPKESIQSQASTSGSTSNSKPEVNKAVADFFESIEEEQTTMFNPQTNSPTSNYFQQQGAVNPFAHMMTGQPQLQTQPTGFVMPQHTAFQQVQQVPNPFTMMGQQSQLQPQPTGHRPFSSFLPTQQSDFMQSQQQQIQQGSFLQPQQAFLQPQVTGANPFRQTMLLPQTTGMAMFGVGGSGLVSAQTGTQNLSQTQGVSAFGNPGATQTTGSSLFAPSPATATGAHNTAPASSLPARPASTPLTSLSSPNTAASPPIAQPVKTHQTGTRNPFGPVSSPPPPPVPKPPTLMELAMGLGSQQQQQLQQPQQQAQAQQPQSTGAFGGLGGFSFGSSSLNPGATDMSGVASSFSFLQSDSGTKAIPSAFNATANPLTTQNTSTTTTGSTISDSLFSSSLSSQATGTTNTSMPSITMTGASSGPVKSHTTGFGGLKPFKPSSSFGASLLESLPPIPGSAPTTPAVTGNSSPLPSGLSSGTTSPNGFSSGLGSTGSSFGSGLGSQPTGLGAFSAQPTTLSSGNFGTGSLGVGLRPQMTGVANPFRASMFSALPNGGSPSPGSGAPSQNPSLSQPASLGSGGSSNQTSLGGSLFGTAIGPSGGPSGGLSAPFGSTFGSNFSQQSSHQQGSLI
ncbi:ANTH-domain-containing protein [Dendrothele bispora CBS 962.96]|uniref:ANTH-domain-containing protein n=1 Tax=Dendrothele bispora (strain CBS 962.96) TaxID=1314807 RepID=A0A4S8LQ24_DENBC|nr:ANTH-domain-containing protein [Dendrothele bispora CBS 962.96]